MLRLIGRERIFRCILRFGLRCGSRLLGRLRLGHFAVNAAQGAVHAEQHHNKFIAEPCSNISDDKQQDRPEKVEKQQNNAVNSQRSDRHAVQDLSLIHISEPTSGQTACTARCRPQESVKVPESAKSLRKAVCMYRYKRNSWYAPLLWK